MRKQVRLHYVYALFYPGTAQPCYIGLGRWRRDTSHFAKCQNVGLRALIEAHGKLPVVRLREQLTQREACELEAMLIKVLGRKDVGTGQLLNRSDGGLGSRGVVITEEKRAKLSAAHKGKKLLPESIAKRSASVRGRKNSPETKAKMAAAARGRTHTAEARAKMSATKSGRPLSAEHVQKVAAALRGKPRSAEACAAIRAGWARRKEAKAA